MKLVSVLRNACRSLPTPNNQTWNRRLLTVFRPNLPGSPCTLKCSNKQSKAVGCRWLPVRQIQRFPGHAWKVEFSTSVLLKNLDPCLFNVIPHFVPIRQWWAVIVTPGLFRPPPRSFVLTCWSSRPQALTATTIDLIVVVEMTYRSSRTQKCPVKLSYKRSESARQI
jgi:hypothetical protein